MTFRYQRNRSVGFNRGEELCLYAKGSFECEAYLVWMASLLSLIFLQAKLAYRRLPLCAGSTRQRP